MQRRRVAGLDYSAKLEELIQKDNGVISTKIATEAGHSKDLSF